MASVWKHPNSKYWTACYTDDTGKQRKKSTKLTNKAAAQKIADQLELVHKKKMSEVQIRKLFTEAYHEIHNDIMKSSTIAEYFEGWIERRKNEVGKATWDKYRVIAERFVTHLGNAANNDINFVTPKIVIEFREAMLETLSPKTVNGYVKVLRVVFNDAWRENLILDNPAAKVPALKILNEEEDKKRDFTPKEAAKLLKAAEGEWIGMILCGFYTGQRLSDIALLKWSQVDLKEKEIRFRTKKTGRITLTQMAPALHDYLKSLKKPKVLETPVFPEKYDTYTKHSRSNKLSTEFYKIMVKAGLAKQRSHAKKEAKEGEKIIRETTPLSFHSFRHSATSILKKSGISDSVTKDIVGHESTSISRQYTHIDKKTKAEAMENLPDIRSL